MSKKYVISTLEKLLALDPFERLFQMGRIIAFYDIRAIDLWEIFPHDHWPVAFMQSKGKIEVGEYKNISKSSYSNILFNEVKMNYIIYRDWNSDTYDGFLINWIGNNILIDQQTIPYGLSMGLMGATEISSEPVEQSYYEAYAQFINPPWEDNPPLIQGVLVQEEDSREPINREDLLEKGFENPKSLDSHELFLLNNHIRECRTMNMM